MQKNLYIPLTITSSSVIVTPTKVTSRINKMIKLFYNLFNHNKIDDLNNTIDIYIERNKQLEDELREYKGYKLKYEVTKMYVEDDDALIELFNLAKEAQAHKGRLQMAADRQRNALAGIAGGLNLIGGTGWLGQASTIQQEWLNRMGY